MKTTLTLSALFLGLCAQAQVTHTLTVVDDEFLPPALTINAGDHVHIVWGTGASAGHTFTQVSQDTWNANGGTPLDGGYNFGQGTPNPGTDFTITPLANVWYVCEFHVDMGMKGTITVQGTAGVEEATAQSLVTLVPNPATDLLTISAPNGAPVAVRIVDAAGRTRKNELLTVDRTVSVADLAQGLYVMEVRTAGNVLLARKTFVVAH